MKLRILLIAIISTAWAQTKNVERPIRAPQRQIKYDDTDSSKVNWKYLAPQSQRHLANIQRYQRGEDGTAPRSGQAQQALQRAPTQKLKLQQVQQLPQVQSQYYSYKPYSAVPSHIKQLIEQNYQPQPPYVDPTSFLYSSSFAAPQQHEHHQLAPVASEVPHEAYLQPSARYQSIDQRPSRLEHGERRVGRQDRVVYKEDYEQQQAQQQQQVTLPVGTLPEPPTPVLYLDKNMPSEIKQLLQYQAQIPYDVIANRIQYKPKNVFIPKPLSDDVKGPYYYRSKVYYMDEDNVDAEYPQDKPVEEETRH